MITKTLQQTKKATFAVLIPHPNPEYKEFPTPKGTGFFISPEGYFITARHVIQKIDIEDKPVLNAAGIPELFDISKLRLTQPGLDYLEVTDITLVSDFPKFDLVILKADFEKNKIKKTFKNKSGFDYLQIDFNVIPEGELIYAFGYPLPEHFIKQEKGVLFGGHTYFPRTTSLIISSHYERAGFVVEKIGFPRYYVIDKALNYGNSGGPIMVQKSGKVISVCTKFQPVTIKQREGAVIIPSLYGVTVSLKNIEEEIKSLQLL